MSGIAACAVSAAVARQVSSAPTADPLATVSGLRGINLPAFQGSSTLQERDLRLISDAGFNLVRQPIHAESIISLPGREQGLAFNRLADLLGRYVDLGFHVCLDVHPDGEFKRKLAESRLERAQLIWLCGQLALLSQFHSEKIYIEVLNEPGRWLQPIWWDYQGEIIENIDRVNSKAVIIASGAGSSSIKNLIGNEPYGRPRIFYNFHYYSPMIYTHQGADWGSRRYSKILNMHWPLASQVEGSTSIPLQHESLNGANLASMSREIGAASDWARRKNAPLICTEFGALKGGASNRDSRLRYLEAVRRVLQANTSGWALWQYRGKFDILKPGGEAFDPDFLVALGLAGVT